MPFYRLLSGKHHSGTRGERQVFHPNDVIKTDEDLVSKFPGRFEEVADVETSDNAEAAKPLRKENSEQASTTTDDDSKDINGKDITSELDAVQELDAAVTVYEKSGWCTIIDNETGKPITKSGVRRSGVGDVVHAWLEEAEGSEGDA